MRNISIKQKGFAKFYRICQQNLSFTCLSLAVINFVTEHDDDLVMALQACEDNPNSKSYQSHFSRNRQFRWRLKKKRQSQLNCQAKEG